MRNKLTKFLIILFFILILFNKDIMYITIYKTTIIWFKNIVPNLFPLFIITSLIVDSGLIYNITNILGKRLTKIFKVSNYGVFVLFLSLFTGVPSNAKYIKDGLDKNIIKKNEANKMLLFTSNYNPFLILTLLSNFLEKKEAIKILLIIILTNIIIGLVNRNISIEIVELKYNKNKINLSKIIKNTVDALLMILGTLIVFNIIINILPIKNMLLKNIINGFLEITTALSNLKYININTNIKSLLSIIYLSFGSLSIHNQIKSIFTDTNYKLYLKNKLLSIIISLSLYGLLI